MLYALLYAFCHSFLFHSDSLWFLANVSLIPLLVGLRRCASFKEAFAFGYFAGVLSNLICYYWMYQVTLAGYLSMSLYLAFYPAIFAGLVRKDVIILDSAGCGGYLFSWSKTVTIACLWTLAEYIQTVAPVLAYGWGLLALSQSKVLPFIQSADIFGQLGITLLLAFNNASILLLITVARNILTRKAAAGSVAINMLPLILLAVFLNGANLRYGNLRLDEINSVVPKQEVKISLIQGNIPQNEKWDARIKSLIINKYLGLSRQAAMDDPQLIIWPETSFPGYLEYEPLMTNEITKLTRDLRTHLLFGSPTFQEGDYGIDRKNSAVLVSPEGSEIKRYNKLRLVPYGEYVPLFKFIRKINNEIGRFSPGSDLTVFRMPLNRQISAKEMFADLYFSVLICFEDTFSDLCRLFVRNGARLLVNITNDGWFGSSTAAYQHAQASIFRAVENRVPVLRSANTGVTCYIDETGEIKEIFELNKNPLLITGYITPNVKLKKLPMSVYTKYGEYWLFGVLLLWILTRIVYLRRDFPPINKDYGD